ncbi:MAG: hypothetical protein ACO1QR_12120 [Chthoniobacteraceae bacterium]
MNLEPQDPWEEYLKNTDLLAELDAKREELLSQREQLESRGHNVDALLVSIDQHRTGILETLALHDEQMDSMLQYAATRAENGRELFIAVAEVMKLLYRLSPEHWAQMPEASQERWHRVAEQFSDLREQWLAQLTPEERQKLEE